MKERTPRKPVSTRAEIILCGKIFTGVAVNLSEDSALVEIPVLHSEIDCLPNSIIELRFDDLPCGPVLVSCRVARIYAEESSGRVLTRVGLKIDHIPQKYKDFFKSLE